jgi:peptidoglycan/LPS O-acetylase OafA/YrhL
VEVALEKDVRLSAAVNRRVIAGLDALRVVAIAMVVLYHSGAPVPGPMGVIIFFVLSGFLITSLLLKEIAATGSISTLNFYRRRAYRIFPTFYVCWFLTILFTLWHEHSIIWSRAMESFFYLADYGRAFLRANDHRTYPMGISWSLAVEEQFYLLWPLTLAWVIRLRAPARAVAVMIAGIWVWRSILLLGFHVPLTYVYNAFDARADALLVGCWLALMVYREKVPLALHRILADKRLVLVPIVVLAILGSLDLKPSPRTILIDLTLEPLFAAMLLLQLAFWGAYGWRFLEHPGIKFVARLSYAIYLYHPLTTAVGDLLHLHHGRGLLGAVLFLPVASASYYWIERPFMRMRDRGRRGSVLMDDGLKHAN